MPRSLVERYSLVSLDLLDVVGDHHVSELVAARFQTVTLADEARKIQVVDYSGPYERWFSVLNACAVLIRPDFYFWDSVESTSQIADLL
jgi:hypothetical protein